MSIQGTVKKNENLFQYLKRTQKDSEENAVPEDLENLPMIEFPPNYSLMPSKPIFLDLVRNLFCNWSIMCYYRAIITWDIQALEAE